MIGLGVIERTRRNSHFITNFLGSPGDPSGAPFSSGGVEMLLFYNC